MSLSLRAVGKDFGSGERVHTAVDDVSIDFDDGRFYALLGPSGCGKTTLLRLIAGFERPTRGAILHRGRPLDGVPPYARGFPMVFQSYALFPHLDVAANVAYGLRIRKVPRQEIARRVDAALALLGLGALRHRHPAQLSGGQQQRVALARCLVLEPEVILLDEPLSSLDAGLRVSMRREIRALQRRLGITAIYVTHDQEEAMSMADCVVVMNRGRIEQIGSPREVYDRPRSEFVARFMGFTNIVPVRSAGAAADGVRVALLGVDYVVDGPVSGDDRAVIRSDAVRLMPDGRHRGQVQDVTYLGARVELLLRLQEGAALSLQLPADHAVAALSAGDQVAFDLLPDRLHFVSGGPAQPPHG